MKNQFVLMMVCLFTMVSMSSAYADAGNNAVSKSEKARLSLYVFEGNKLVKDFYVWMDKGVKLNTPNQDKVSSNENGGASFTLNKGAHQLSVAREGYDNAVINLNVVENENLQIIVTQYPGKVIPHVSIESSQDNIPKKKSNTALKITGEPGILKGRITNSENSEPVVGARLFFSGLPTDFETDKDGYFEAKVPSSTYSISILHNRFASQTLDNIEVKAGKTVEKQITVTPAGIALKEFVVVAPFIQGSVSSLVDERKETKVISDFIGAEQMSKSGDGDAAAALTRVAGLNLIDGKYAVVRGMEDRYTTVLMNGAVMRSPDPNSKSVDLDLFPASILDSIEVQKTYSADAPGAFGGGLIKLRTKALPEDDFFKFKISTGGNTKTTGKGIISQDSGSTDYLGYDDGGRELPVSTTPGQVLTESEAEQFETRFATSYETATPNFGGSIAFGQVFDVKGMAAGYQAYFDYSNDWSSEVGEANTYAANGSTLTQRNDQEYEKSSYKVDSTALFSAAIEDENLLLKSTTSLIRKSERNTKFYDGVDGENDEVLEKYTLEWTERELFSQQFNGEHKFSKNVKADWEYGFSTASVYTPDSISYRFDDSNNPGSSELLYRDGNTGRDFLEITDNNQTLGANLSALFNPVSFLSVNLKSGYSFNSTERESEMKRYSYNWFSVGDDPYAITSLDDINEILSDDNIRSDGFLLRDTTSSSDSYEGSQETTAMYALMETTWFDDFDLIVGVRSESFTQTLDSTNALTNADISIDQTTDVMLPSFLTTYRFMDGLQVRLAVAQTINRPTMLELSPSFWVDPESGNQSIGNPRLAEAEISHFDLRIELYGTGANSVSVAYFSKDFTNPIEKTFETSSGSDQIITYQNAQSATNSGIEFDFRWELESLSSAGFLYGLTGNYSIIDSEVVLEKGHTEYSDQRSMQGQSPYTMNFMFTLDNDNWGVESAFILNEIGERITQVGQGDLPHIYEESFTALDFTLSKEFDQGKLSLKLKNLLDSERLYTQGGETYKRSEPGMSYSVSYGMSF